MIRLEKISKQNGTEILFIEASASLQKGEKWAGRSERRRQDHADSG